MEACEKVLSSLEETHKGAYIGSLANELSFSLKKFTGQFASSLLFETKSTPQIAFRLRKLIISLDQATETFRDNMETFAGIKEMTRFIHNYQENKKLFMFIPSQKRADLFLFNVNKSKVDKIGISELKSVKNYAAVFLDKNIFICGGEDHQQVVTRQCFLLNPKTVETIEKAGMNGVRSLHTLVVVCKSGLYALGGSVVNNYGRVYLKSTERYSSIQNKWVAGPLLTERKSGVAAITLNDRFIYCFGGYRKEDMNIWLNTIERLDMLEEYEGWKVVERTLEKKAYDIGITQVSNSEIILFGGSGENFEWQRTSEIYNPYKKTMKSIKKDLKQSGKFTQCRCIKLKGKVYALDEEMRDIHLYSIENQRWFLCPIAELY